MDDRKKQVLTAVIDEYIKFGEPVGSKVIAENYRIGASAATIRNELAELEALGFIEKPHTSAGRIPTYLGYRFYIGEIISENILTDEEKIRIDALFDDDDIFTEDILIQTAASALAEITSLATVVSNTPKFSVISKVEVIPTGHRVYVILLITSEGNVKNKACRLKFDIDDEQLEFFSKYIKQSLQGIPVDQITDEMLGDLALSLGTYTLTLEPLLRGLAEVSSDIRQEKIRTHGESNLLAHTDLDRAEVMQFIEQKNAMTSLLDESFDGIKVLFGHETKDFVIDGGGMVLSKYYKGGQEAGSLGVIGPMRLDYKKIIPYVEYLSNKITEMLE